MARTGRFLTVASSFLCWVVIGTSQAIAASDDVPLPEYFMRQGGVSLCLTRVDLNQAANPASLFKFIDKAFELSSEWVGEFGVVGVDYVNFKKFFFVSRSICGDTKKYRVFLDAFFPQGATLTLVNNSKSKYVASLTGYQNGPVQFFHQYKPNVHLQQCMVSFRNGGKLEPMELAGEIKFLTRKYRFPILDSNWANNDFVLLFSNFCSHRKILMDHLFASADRERIPLRSSVRQINMTSGEAEYTDRFVAR